MVVSAGRASQLCAYLGLRVRDDLAAQAHCVTKREEGRHFCHSCTLWATHAACANLPEPINHTKILTVLEGGLVRIVAIVAVVA